MKQKLKIENVLMDVDGTMTLAEKGTGTMRISPLDHLANLVAAADGGSREEALSRINEVGDIQTTCLFDMLDTLGVSKAAYWTLLRGELERTTHMAEDAVCFIKDLKAKGIKLFSATTNSPAMTLLKMSLAGLATIDGSPYMAGFFGGNAFNDPEGKYSANFFPAIMGRGKFDPETTMMVGDEIERDLKPALKAGIKHVVMVDRGRQEPMSLEHGAVFVNSLRVVSEMIVVGGADHGQL